MTANIYGDRFAGHREPAWHGLGKVFQEELTPLEAVKLAGLDYEVNKWPLLANVAGIMYETPLFGLYRDPDKNDKDQEFVYFGSVSKDYQVIQNTEIAQIIEPISKLWPVETVGALGKGETMFMTLDAGELDIKGDLLHQYYMISDTKDGGHCLRIDTTPVRVVCGNTYELGISQATMTMALNHGRDPRSKLEAISKTIEKMQASGKVIVGLLEDLTKVKVSPAQLQKMVLDVYPTPDVSEVDVITAAPAYVRRILNWKERVEATQLALVELYTKFNDEYPQFGQTNYAFYNAVVELEDYKTGRNAAQSAIFGNRARTKEKAFEMCLANI
jgi:phage/plasmid-like protein (TIGR03299 family)